MRVLIVNRFFWPDESSTAMLAADLAQDLAAAGHEVQVACARLLYDKPEKRLAAREVWQGVGINRLPSTRFGRTTLPGRLLDLLTFHAALFFIAPFRYRPDVVLVMTDPAMVLLDGVWIARLSGARVVHHVMDLYPDIASALGTIRSGGVLERMLGFVMRGLLSQCDHLIALGGSMADRLEGKGAPRDSISVIPPWATDAGSPAPTTGNTFRSELGLGVDDLLVMYSGNMGRGHEFGTIIEAATRLADDARIHFLFVGGGEREGEIREAIAGRNLSRFRILPYQPRERLAETLSAADVHLITQIPETAGLIVPSKLAGILAAGRPTVHVGAEDSEIGRALLSGGCGMTFAPGSGEVVADAIRDLKSDAEKRARMGENARALYLREYERGACTARIRAILEAAGAD